MFEIYKTWNILIHHNHSHLLILFKITMVTVMINELIYVQ